MKPSSVGSTSVSRLGSRVAFEAGNDIANYDALRTFSFTKELVNNPDVPAIFEGAFGAFQYQGVIVKTDVLVRRNRNRWRLVEVNPPPT